MSVVKEVIESLQNLLTPKLGEISGQLQGIISRLDVVDRHLDRVESRQDKDCASLLDEIRKAKTEIQMMLEVKERREKPADRDRIIQQLQKTLPAQAEQ
jgi:hypothetical protein